MASFVSALDQPNAAPNATATATRMRACLRFLRHVERVDFHATMARNWDARKCFVVHVTVKDDEVATVDDADAARLSIVRPTTPFQIERTPKELEQLQTAMHQWSVRHESEDASQSCAFCSPIASGNVAIAARRASGSAGDGPSTKSRGVLSSLFQRRATKLMGADEWETWLNASIELLRRVDVDAMPMCEGLQHIPALLARFLLQEFASDVIL